MAIPSISGKPGVFNRVAFGFPLRRRGSSTPPDKKIEEELSPAHAIGELLVTNFEDSSIPLVHEEI
jgi:hypothetical protein